MSDTLTAFPGLPYYDEDDVFPVTRITAGAVGDIGRRTFILQVHVGAEPFSWIIDKAHALALSRAIPRLLDDILGEFPEVGEPLVAAAPNLALHEPLRPLFRVGSLGVGYDRVHDLVVLTLIDAALFNPEALQDDDNRQTIYTTRGQAFLLSQQTEQIVAAGRPYCPGCGEPMDDFGHFCLPPRARDPHSGDYLH